MTRYVLVHNHIYKNAGSSVERALWTSFGNRFTMLDPVPGQRTVTDVALQRFLLATPGIKAVSSHRFWPHLRMRGVLPIVFFRHPIDRARSVYRFARVSKDVPDHTVARDATFSDYVAWSLGRCGEGSVLRNHQAERLACGGWRDVNAWDMPFLKRFVARLPAPGLVRRFDESCRLLRALYQPLIPAADFTPVAENTTGDAGLSDAAALEQVRDELDAARFRMLWDANRLDLELYEYASAAFAAKVRGGDRVGRIGWRAALAMGRIRQRVREPELFSGKPYVWAGMMNYPGDPAKPFVRIGE